jgi:restriction endonuclease S subunit
VKNYTKISCRRYLKSILNGSTADQGDPCETSVPVTRIETISKGVIDPSKIGHVQYHPSLERYRLKSGDILLSHINSMDVIGNVALYEDEGPLYVGMNLLRLRPQKFIFPKFLYYCFVSQETRHQIRQFAKPAINQASISTANLKRIELPLTDLSNQYNYSDHQR